MIGLSIAILGLFSFAIFAAHAFDAYIAKLILPLRIRNNQPGD